MNTRRRTLGVAVVLCALDGAGAQTARAQSPGETLSGRPGRQFTARAALDTRRTNRHEIIQPSPTPSFRRNPKAFLQEKGFDVSFSWADIYQGAISGDPEDLSEHSGRIALSLRIDGEKIGLWRGFAISAIGEALYGDPQ